MRLLTYQMPDELLVDCECRRVRRVRPQRVLRGCGYGTNAQFKHKVATFKIGWISFAGFRAPARWPSMRSRPARARPSHTPMFACFRTSNTRSGSCPMSRRATRWRTCWPQKHNVFWHDYGRLLRAGASAGIGLDALPPVRKPSAAVSTRKPSPSRAANSPPASQSRSGRRSSCCET